MQWRTRHRRHNALDEPCSAYPQASTRTGHVLCNLWDSKGIIWGVGGVSENRKAAATFHLRLPNFESVLKPPDSSLYCSGQLQISFVVLQRTGCIYESRASCLHVMVSVAYVCADVKGGYEINASNENSTAIGICFCHGHYAGSRGSIPSLLGKFD